MPKEFPRTRRVSELLRRELAQLIHDAIDDPRGAMVSITNVLVSKDLGQAKVYVTILSDDAASRAAIVTHLNEIAGLLRHNLAHQVRMRSVPRLRFLYDETVERGARLSALIAAAVAEDEARHESQNDDEAP
ncbi:MAG: 30S ribosome-binding factor RbfA [Gammaproteobacteria bacterium]|nr:30S ribosome-binding factor RbfA [Gammaproteobacteria bacterium]MCP5425401.1 30S ribosome-binding factor RbfA [Gammaproteobacteria bacterium]MCP5459271.1 30S ribosome-binding factor RbfA [Gammaproteobacteria bacterium]